VNKGDSIMSNFNLTQGYLYTFNSMPRGKDKKTQITNTCNIPYNTITVDLNANCLICGCDAWLPISVGKVEEFDSIEEVMQSPIAKILQNDVTDKKYTWCAVENCGIANNDIVSNQFSLNINVDESCNLKCPSCRRDTIMHTSGEVVAYKKRVVAHIMSWLSKFKTPIHIRLSGNGDPLASLVIRPLIKHYRPSDTQTFTLQTNGLLIKKQLNNSPLLPNITTIIIGVDAGSRSVYENVRAGGKWNILIENFEFLVSIKKNKIVSLTFALQNNNYTDLENFIDICNRYGFKGTIHGINDWGTWNSMETNEPDTWTISHGIYADQDVLNATHTNYNKCKAIVKNILSHSYNNINVGNVDVVNKLGLSHVQQKK
jgi:molybdenum cofactor biosynthesis enzyme MoaA